MGVEVQRWDRQQAKAGLAFALILLLISLAPFACLASPQLVVVAGEVIRRYGAGGDMAEERAPEGRHPAGAGCLFVSLIRFLIITPLCPIFDGLRTRGFRALHVQP